LVKREIAALKSIMRGKLSHLVWLRHALEAATRFAIVRMSDVYAA
jgi:hypothetical protein